MGFRLILNNLFDEYSGQGTRAFCDDWIHPKLEKSYLTSGKAKITSSGSIKNTGSLKVMWYQICEFSSN